MPPTPPDLPRLALKPREDRRLRRGHRWVYESELADAPADLAAGASVLIVDAAGKTVGSALYNPASRIRARLFARQPADYAAEIPARVAEALALRERLYPTPHYRLAFGESDGLPGLTVDRFGPVLVAQFASAVAEAHAEALADALLALPGVQALVLRRDANVRAREGLEELEPEVRGTMPAEVFAEEDGLRFRVDPLGGMKGGWFYDQRESRAFVRRAAAGAELLDLFCHTGGFALQAVAGGAARALGLDRSEDALALARQSAKAAGLAKNCRFKTLDLFASGQGARGWPHGDWGLVVLDPPALAKSRGEIEAALGGYEHLNRKAAGRVAPGGLLVTCSCTHFVEERVWTGVVLKALHKAGREAAVVHRGGQGPDHPVLPGMPETRYLKVLVLRLR